MATVLAPVARMAEVARRFFYTIVTNYSMQSYIDNDYAMDYSNEPTIIKRENFRDAMQLHDEGAHVWSSFLANKIKENYESFN